MMDSVRKGVRDILTARPASPQAHPMNEHRRRLSGGTGHKWWSDALGVDPSQVEDARQELRKHGIYAEFDNTGALRVESQKQVRDICRAVGIYTGRDGYTAGGLTGKQPRRAFEELKRQVLKDEGL